MFVYMYEIFYCCWNEYSHTNTDVWRPRLHSKYILLCNYIIIATVCSCVHIDGVLHVHCYCDDGYTAD